MNPSCLVSAKVLAPQGGALRSFYQWFHEDNVLQSGLVGEGVTGWQFLLLYMSKNKNLAICTQMWASSSSVCFNFCPLQASKPSVCTVSSSQTCQSWGRFAWYLNQTAPPVTRVISEVWARDTIPSFSRRIDEETIDMHECNCNSGRTMKREGPDRFCYFI